MPVVRHMANSNELLVDAFRQLREAWYYLMLHKNSHERQWEDEDEADERERRNAEVKSMFDADTEAIIRGESKIVKPMVDDLYKAHASD